VLAKYPGIRASLVPVFASLDGAILRRLNARIAVDGEDARHVAADYLGSLGLVR
jgi:osmoprotectant transport system substrate-binding protein